MFKDCNAYWKQVVQDYIECSNDFDIDDFTESEKDEVVHYLLIDDEMWTAIDESVSWYLAKIKDAKQKKESE